MGKRVKINLKIVNKIVPVMWCISGYILISFIQYQLLKNVCNCSAVRFCMCPKYATKVFTDPELQLLICSSCLIIA